MDHVLSVHVEPGETFKRATAITNQMPTGRDPVGAGIGSSLTVEPLRFEMQSTENSLLVSKKPVLGAGSMLGGRNGSVGTALLRGS